MRNEKTAGPPTATAPLRPRQWHPSIVFGKLESADPDLDEGQGHQPIQEPHAIFGSCEKEGEKQVDEETARHDEKLEPGDVIDFGHPVSRENVACEEKGGDQRKDVGARVQFEPGDEAQESRQRNQADPRNRVKHAGTADKNLQDGKRQHDQRKKDNPHGRGTCHQTHPKSRKDFTVPGRARTMRELDSNAGSWEKHTSLMPRIAIVGLGYVGLPLALAFARRGCPVVGLDVDAAKIEKLNAGQGYLQHVDSSDLSVLVGAGTFRASVDFAEVCGCDAAIICVPTPLDRHREPDLSYVLDTGRALARHLPKGILVVLESTTYPGTTDEDLRRVLEKGSGLKAGTDFHLAFSPEREDPGNPKSKVAEIPKVVGGYTPACLEKAVAIYSLAINNVVPVSSCRAAEATKLLENIFRAVNIALINELKVVYGAMDIDIWEVIEAAKTKPFGFMPFYPGPGLGGHCIPIDPFYLTWKAREFGQHTRFIELAGEINTAMPRYVVEKVGEALNNKKRPLNGSRILIVGLAYKADVDDIRESPTFVLMELLEARGAVVGYFDPYVPVIPPTREHAHFTGRKSVDWGQAEIASHDCVLISTAHKCVDYSQLSAWADCIVDTRNVVPPNPNLTKA